MPPSRFEWAATVAGEGIRRLRPAVQRAARYRGAMTAPKDHPTTPDGRYFVVRGRLWRKANPALAPERREALVRQLMDARRALRGDATDADADAEAERAEARRRVDEAKRALGERGPVWWDDGAPDYNRRMARNTPYADWFASVQIDGGRDGD